MVDLVNKKRVNYDKLVGSSRDFTKQIEWMDKLFKKYGVKTVLDAGCGTGTHAVLLAKKGYLVSAFDYSKGQVELAKEKAKQNNVKINFYVGDIRDFDFGKFDAIVSFFAPIMFGCKNKSDLKKAILSIKNSLSPNGIAFIETMDSKMMESSGLEILKHADKDFKAARLAFYDFNKDKKSAKIKYVEVIENNKKITIDKSEANHYYYDKKDFEEVFKSLDIKLINWYSSFNDKKGKYDLFSDKVSWMITPLFRK
ncbi:MAG: class I SAM-dependent methyltransferase [Candidatus Nanoarchaeia archaeon]|jgi:2-polyprenyl-3-methyl-5-hydroxy-6-metoxy-1,4-benzoquinol methylase